MIEPIAGLSTKEVGKVILAKEGHLLWWEEAGALHPTYPAETQRRWLFHDVVQAMALRTLLAPPSPDLVPKTFCPLTDGVLDQILEVRGILFTYDKDIRDLSFYLGPGGEVLATNGKMVGDSKEGFCHLSVAQVESLSHSQVGRRSSPVQWDLYMRISEETRRRGLKLPQNPLYALI